jgi:tRNA isopentenyl-2-thiomethyl-A-37 hydroxylase MiaE
MNTIEDRWLIFRTRCLSSHAHAIQLHEMRVAFYAGFKAMLDANLHIAELDDVTAILELELLQREARHFGDYLAELADHEEKP